MNDSQLLERLASTDAYAPGAPLPSSARTRHAAVAEIERRTDMPTQTETVPPMPQSRARNGWLAAAAAFVVVLIVGAAMVFLAGQGNEDVVEPSTTTSVPTTITTVPPPPEPVPPMVDAWQRVGGALMGPVVGTFDMIDVGSRLIVVGFDPGEDNFRQNGVIFASDDGLTWERLAEDDPALNLGAVLMYGVTDGGPGLVAVGMGCENEAEGCAPYATVWTSVDGSSWTRSPYDAAIFGGTSAQTSFMAGVADTSLGLIAVGSMDYWTLDDEGVEELVTTHPTVWTSADGITWERSWEDVGSVMLPDDYGGPTVYMDAVVEGPDGQLVAVGGALDENGESIAAVWTSANGLDWERTAPDPGVFSPGTIMLDVTWGEHGFVAVGSGDGSEAGIWQSSDGTSWTRIDTSDQPFDTIGSLSSVAALDSGYTTVGPYAFIDDRGGWVTLWTSPDGLEWDRVHAIGEGYTSAVVVVDGGIAVAGGMSGADNFHAAVWVGPLFDPEAPPPDPEPPLPEEPAPEEPATGIAALEEGLSCEEIAAQEFTYAEAVSYWMRYDMPADLDPDGNGVPCEAFYLPTDVAAVFGGLSALPVRLVSDLPARFFEASGAAVDAGVICPGGTTEFTDNSTPPLQAGASRRWENIYTCDDGSGTFTIGADVFIEIGGLEYGVWDISSGTGRYEAFTGGGGVFTGPTGSGTWSDDLIGRLTSGTNEN